MVKIKNPLLSLRASGLVGAISYVRRRKTDIAEKTPVVPDAKSLAQLSWRHMYLKAVALWHALSVAEKEDWESQARSRHMTGFAWFMSQALKPNPGLYLPLQGGTMSGDIDMAKHRLLRLPAPADPQEAIRLAEYTANIAPYLYNECCRAYHSADQFTVTGVWKALDFNSERWDTDNMHDLVVNNWRITCQTAGKYIVSVRVRWEQNAVGNRQLVLYINNAVVAGRSIVEAINGLATDDGLTSTCDLGVGDYVNVNVWQDSGGGLNILSKLAYSPEFMAQRVGA